MTSTPRGPGARRSRAPWGPAAARRCADNPCCRSWLDHRAALLAHELRDVVRSASPFAARARALPAGEWLRARPGAGRCPGALVDVAHPRFHFVEEARDLRFAARENPRREPVVPLVRLRDGLVESTH